MLTTGCLSVPGPADGPRDAAVDAGPSADGGDGGDGDGGGDGGVACTARPPGTPSVFAPTPAGLRPGAVADLNCDGRDDLLLLNIPRTSQSQGVYVMLGRPQGVGSVHDGFLPTGSAEPYHVMASDFTADGRLDLLVLAGEDSGGTPDNDRAVLFAFEASGAGPASFTARGRVELTPAGFPNFAPSYYLPCHLARAQLDDDPALELVITDYDGIVTAEVTSFAPLALADVREVPVPVAAIGGANWNALQVQPIPSRLAPGRQDLIVQTQWVTIILANGSGGLALVGSSFVPSTADSPGFGGGMYFLNLDGGDMPDVFGVGGDGAGAVLLESGQATRVDWRFLASSSLGLPDRKVDWSGVGPLGGDARADLVLLDRDEMAGGPARLLLLTDLGVVLSPPSVGAQAALSRSFAAPQPLRPDTVIVGDFDGVPPAEVVAIDGQTPAITCVRVAAGGAALEACPAGP